MAFGLFNLLKSWAESYVGYWMTGLPSDSVPGESNFLFSSRKWLCMRGGRGLGILTHLTSRLLFFSIKEEHEMYLTCLFNVTGFLESRKQILLCSVINKKWTKSYGIFPCVLFYSYPWSKTQISERGNKPSRRAYKFFHFSTSLKVLHLHQSDITSMLVFFYYFYFFLLRNDR